VEHQALGVEFPSWDLLQQLSRWRKMQTLPPAQPVDLCKKTLCQSYPQLVHLNVDIVFMTHNHTDQVQGHVWDWTKFTA
jgi:hypothetical protein